LILVLELENEKHRHTSWPWESYPGEKFSTLPGILYSGSLTKEALVSLQLFLLFFDGFICLVAATS